MKVVPDAAVWADAPVEQAALQELMGGLVNRLLPGFLTEQRVRDLSVRKTRRPTEQVKDSLFQRGHNAARDVAERPAREPPAQVCCDEQVSSSRSARRACSTCSDYGTLFAIR